MKDGSFKGMIAEVITGEVDTSVAAFINNMERNEVVDFTQGILKVVETLIIKTPTKSDQISFITRKYILAQFSHNSFNKTRISSLQNFQILHGLQF